MKPPASVALIITAVAYLVGEVAKLIVSTKGIETKPDVPPNPTKEYSDGPRPDAVPDEDNRPIV